MYTAGKTIYGDNMGSIKKNGALYTNLVSQNQKKTSMYKLLNGQKQDWMKLPKTV